MGLINAEIINKNLGIGNENPILDGMNDRYRFLEERSDYKRKIGELLGKKTEFSPDILDKRLGLEKNPTLEAMGDYYSSLQRNGSLTMINNRLSVINNELTVINKELSVVNNIVYEGKSGIHVVHELAGPVGPMGPQGPQGPQGKTGPIGPRGINGKDGKDADMKQVKEFMRRYKNYKNHVTKSNLLNALKKGGATALILGLSAGALWGLKNLLNNRKTAEEKAPENQSDIVVNQDTIKTEDTRNLKLNADGTYVANEGDCFNTIAKRYLNDIYLNEPDSFANLSFAKKENKIFNETNRILSINPKYEWDSAHYQTNPELMVGDIIKVK